ncbi:MAG: hypothetical protein ACLT38_12670 [Akkermansia sp.]
MFILANGLHMQKHFTFHWDASRITGTEANPERIFRARAEAAKITASRTLRGAYSFKLVRQPEAC